MSNEPVLVPPYPSAALPPLEELKAEPASAVTPPPYPSPKVEEGRGGAEVAPAPPSESSQGKPRECLEEPEGPYKSFGVGGLPQATSHPALGLSEVLLALG